MSASTITLIIAIIGCVVGVLGFFRNSKNDSAMIAEFKGSILQELKNINQTLVELKAIQSSQNEKLLDHENRITKIESKS